METFLYEADGSLVELFYNHLMAFSISAQRTVSLALYCKSTLSVLRCCTEGVSLKINFAVSVNLRIFSASSKRM